MSEAVAEVVAPVVVERADFNTEIPVVENNEVAKSEGKENQTQGNNTAPNEVSLYQDIIAKYNADNSYKMTDKESDIYLSIQAKIQSGEIKEPPLKGSTSDKKEEATKEETKEEVAKEEEPMTDKSYDILMEAMTKVGAKDVTELPEKIEGLLRKMSESGGKLGSENVALKKAMEEMKTRESNHIQWMTDLKQGKAEAVDYFVNKMGVDPSVLTKSKNSYSSENVPDLNNLDEFVDDKLAGIVKNLTSQLQDQKKVIDELKGRDKERADEVLTYQAISSYVDEVVKVATSDTAKMLGLTPAEARGLAESYFDPKTTAIHPKFQKMHELIVFANDKKMPDLESAYVLMQHKNGTFANQVAKATKDGQKTTKFTPSINTVLSEQNSRAGNNIPDPHITDDVLNEIMNGAFNKVPDNWTDPKTGNLIKSKIPERFHAKIFGSKV